MPGRSARDGIIAGSLPERDSRFYDWWQDDRCDPHFGRRFDRRL